MIFLHFLATSGPRCRNDRVI